MDNAQQFTENRLNEASAAYTATQSRLSAIIGLPFYNRCKGIDTPQFLHDEIAQLKQILPQQKAELAAAYSAHLTVNGITR